MNPVPENNELTATSSFPLSPSAASLVLNCEGMPPIPPRQSIARKRNLLTRLSIEELDVAYSREDVARLRREHQEETLRRKRLQKEAEEEERKKREQEEAQRLEEENKRRELEAIRLREDEELQKLIDEEQANLEKVPQLDEARQKRLEILLKRQLQHRQRNEGLSDSQNPDDGPSSSTSSGNFLTTTISDFLTSPRKTPPNYDKNSFLLQNAEIIYDYLIVGTGEAAKAIKSPSGRVFTATVYRKAQASKILRVMYRVRQARKYYHEPDCADLMDSVVPNESEFVRVHPDRYVLFSPSESDNLHSYATERSDKVTELEVMNLMEQVFRIVNFCHKLGIIVRDFKPRRMLMMASGTSKKVTLGFIQQLIVLDDPENDQIREKFITPAYVPPEVLVLNRESGTYSGKAADIWGAGVLLYMLLIGQYPFYDTTPAGVFKKILRAQVTYPICNVSLINRSLISRMLCKNLDNRISASGLLATNLFTKNEIRCRSKLEIRLFELQQKINQIQKNLVRVNYGMRARQMIAANSFPIERLALRPMEVNLSNLLKEFQSLSHLRKQESVEEENFIRARLDDRDSWPEKIKKMVRKRLQDINDSIKREDQDLGRLGFNHPAPCPKGGVKESHLPCELLLPPEVYPPRRDYHPTNHPLEYRVHNALIAFNRQHTRDVRFGSQRVNFRRPMKFTGRMRRFDGSEPALPYNYRQNDASITLKNFSKKMEVDPTPSTSISSGV